MAPMVRFFFLVLCAFVSQQQLTAQQSTPTPSQQPLTSSSTIVLVPVMVKDRSGDTVLSLTSEDFAVTDDGVPQKIRVQDGADQQPLALVIVAQNGGVGTDHLRDYGDLDPILDAVVGAVPHKIAVVSFDSQPRTVQRF